MNSLEAVSLTALNRANADPTGEKINQLFKKVFQIDRSLEDWRWKFFENPHGDPIVLIGLANDEVVAHYGLLPRKISFEANTHTAYQEVDVMIHPDFVHGGLFRKMGHAIYELASSDGALFTFGFPNQTSLPPGQRFLRWRPICPIPLYTWYLDPAGKALGKALKRDLRLSPRNALNRLLARPVKSAPGVLIRELSSVPELLVKTWDSLSRSYAIHGCRDRTYLNWRYRLETPNAYRIIEAGREETGSGWAVISTQHPDELHIVELIADPADIDIWRSLLSACLGAAYHAGKRILRAWALQGSSQAKAFESLGLHPRDSKLYHVIHSFQSPEMNRLIWDDRRWYISSGDSDCV